MPASEPPGYPSASTAVIAESNGAKPTRHGWRASAAAPDEMRSIAARTGARTNRVAERMLDRPVARSAHLDGRVSASVARRPVEPSFALDDVATDLHLRSDVISRMVVGESGRSQLARRTPRRRSLCGRVRRRKSRRSARCCDGCPDGEFGRRANDASDRDHHGDPDADNTLTDPATAILDPSDTDSPTAAAGSTGHPPPPATARAEPDGAGTPDPAVPTGRRGRGSERGGHPDRQLA